MSTNSKANLIYRLKAPENKNIYILLDILYISIDIQVINMPKLKFTNNEIIERKGHKVLRYPNLNTVIMVEDFLKKNRDMPISLAELRKKLPKQVMHQTLKIILEYLWKSGKIIYGPKGIQWIYAEATHIKKMLEDGLEI